MPNRTAPWILVGAQVLVDHRRTVQAGPARDVVVDVEHRARVRCLEALQVEREHGHALPARDVVGAVENHPRDLPQAIAKLPPELHFARMDLLDPLLEDPRHARVETRDARQVRRAVFHPVRVLVEVMPLGALDPRSPRPGLADLDAVANRHAADAHGAHQALVAGEADDVGPKAVERDGNDAGTLAHVEDQMDAALAAGLADGRHVLNRPDDVRRVIHHDGPRLRAHFRDDLPRIDVAIGLVVDPVGLHAVLVLQRPDRAQRGVVLEVRGDDVVAGIDEAEDGQVERVGRVVAEHRAVRIGSAEEAREQLPRLVHHRPGLQAQVEAAAARIHAVAPVELVHRPVDDFRLRERRGAVVKVDEFRMDGVQEVRMRAGRIGCGHRSPRCFVFRRAARARRRPGREPARPSCRACSA